LVLFDNLVAWGQVVTAYFPSGLQLSGLQSACTKTFMDYAKAHLGKARMSQ